MEILKPYNQGECMISRFIWFITLFCLLWTVTDTHAQTDKIWSKKFSKVKTDPNAKAASGTVKTVHYGSMIYRKNAAPINAPDIAIINATNTTQSENSIIMDPNNPNVLLNSNNSTSWNGSSVGTLYGTSGFMSTNGGLTWFGSVNGTGGDNSGDPAVGIARNGRYYVGYIAADGGQGVAWSTNQGTNWTHVQVGVFPGSGGLLDKNHLWVDMNPASPYVNNVYSIWTNFGGTNDNQIEVVRSTNGGLNWSSALNISSAVSAGSHNQGVNIQTGPNGEVYAVWAIYDGWPQDEPRMGFAKSTNGGASWLTAQRIGPTIKGIRNSGLLGGKEMRNASFPSMTVNQQNGHLYVTWVNIGVPGVNTGTERDIYMMKSTDGGNTWLTPVRVNQDTPNNGKDQWFPWIACDPSTGTLACVFYDSRDFTANDGANTYVAVSNDGGTTWEDFRVSDVGWDCTAIPGLAGGYAGDYIGISMLNGKVVPVWTDNRGGNHLTYVSPFTLSDPSDPKPVTAASAYSDYTSPSSMDIVWTDPTEFSNGDPIDTFVVDIYRADTLRGTVPKGTEFFTENGLIDGTQWTYKLKVRHYPTDSLSITTETAPWYVGGHPVPNGATNLQVTSDVSSAYLKWHNPTTNLDGTPIDDLDSIRIFRNGVHIANVEYTDVADSTYTDVIYTLDGAYYTYKVQVIDNETPVNAGAFSNEAQVYVGPVPAIAVHPETVSFSVVTGEIDTNSYWIYNTGADTLKISGIRAEELTTETFVPKWTQEQKYTSEYPKGSKEPTFGRVTEGSGGPDPFGYKWKDSDAPGGPSFDWFDISGLGTALTFSSADDGYADLTIPFNFKYYGATYTQARVRTNGWLGFNMSSTSTAYSNAAIPAVADPNLALYPFWDDMDLDDGGTVYYYHDSGNGRFIIQFHGVSHYGGGGTYTYQVLLYPSGRIVFQYLTMTGTLNSATIGMENSDGTMGLQCVYNADYVHDNMAIVFQKGVEWLVQTPMSGDVAPGDSMEVTAIVNATGLVGATYNAQVYIDHNIPLQPPYEHPLVSMLVTGATDIGVTPDTLDFGTNYVTIPDTLEFTVLNTGTDTLHVSGMTNDSSQFTIAGNNAFDVPVGESINVKVVFMSAVAGMYEDIVVITSDGTSGTKYVHLFGEAVEMPELTLIPDSLYFIVDPAMTDSAYLGLFNTGLGTMEVTGIEIEEITTEGLSSFVQEQKYTPDYPKGAEEPTFGAQTEGSGGPDPYGYKWKDSDAPGGPGLNFIDISGTGTQITFSSNDDAYATIPLPFPVKFYGNTYSGNLTVSTNGWVGFDSYTSSYLTNAAIPATVVPNNIIALFWDDLNGNNGGSKVVYQAVGNKFIVQWVNWNRYGNTGGDLNFQVILTQNSDKVELQYATMTQGTGTTSSHTIGIENAGGTMGLQCVYNAAYVHGNLAIVFSKGVDWLTVSPLTGTVVPGDSMMVKAVVNSTGLSGGTYLARLTIISNDPVTPTHFAKVTLNVGSIDVDPDAVAGPKSYALHQNYPNPFNPTTTIKYDLKDAGKVTLKVYNILGQEVRTLVNKNETAGFKSVVWDGKDNAGRMVSSGLYIYRIEAGKFVKSHKMMFLK